MRMKNPVGADLCVSPDEKNNNCKNSHEQNRANTQVRLYKSNLPEGWVELPMNNVCTIILGQSPPSSTYNVNSEGLPFFQGKAEFGERYPTVIKYCSTPKKIAQKNDILISVRAPVGPTNIAPSECCIGRGLAAIRPLEGAEHLYIFYYLRSIEHELSEKGTGTTFKAISGSDLRSISIPLAPPDQQKLIVAEIEKQFSRLDEAVAALKRIQANLKRYKASVLKAAVEGKLTEEWCRKNPDVEPASELLKRILVERRKKWEEDYVKKYVGAHGHAPKDDSWKKEYKEPARPDITNLPELPKRWVWVTLGQLLDDALIGLDRGRSQQSYKPGGTPYIKMNNITMDGKVIFDDLVYVKTTLEEIFRFNVKEGDLLFNTRNSKELVGKVGLLKNLHVEAIYNNNLMRLRMPNSVKSNFICAQMCSLEFRRRMELVKKATTNVAAIYAKDLFPLPIALPPSYEQELIMAEVERLLSVADEIEIAIEFNLKRAERLRQSILKKAFSGNLKILAL